MEEELVTVLVGRCPHFSHAESWNLQVDEWLKDFSLKEREEYSNVKALNANDVRKAVRSVSLFAHYLVHKALAQVGVDLNSVAYSRNDFGRPLYIGGVPLDASISHEQDCAAVAALRACSEHARVGIDLVNTSDKSFRQLEPFRELFRGEWDTIEQSPSRLPIFWAIKEAKSKALGNGLFADTAKTRAILLDTSLDLKGRQSVVVSVVDYLLERRGDLAPVAVKELQSDGTRLATMAFCWLDCSRLVTVYVRSSERIEFTINYQASELEAAIETKRRTLSC